MLSAPPPELVILKDWIVTLSPIWGAALIILWKPMKALWQRIYKKYVAAPDENQKARLDSIEKNVQMLIDRQNLSHDAYIALLHDRIYQCCKQYIGRGCITSEELNNLEYLYNPYHAAGGNGAAKKMYSDCQELPLK